MIFSLFRHKQNWKPLEIANPHQKAKQKVQIHYNKCCLSRGSFMMKIYESDEHVSHK